MSDYIYHIGNDYDCINKEYVILSTDKGQQITVALAASGVPFKGRYDNETIFFDYDRNYKESVDEIIAKFTSDDYAEQRREIDEHKGADCKRYVYNWYCDTYTIQHELKDAMMLITKPEP